MEKISSLAAGAFKDYHEDFPTAQNKRPKNKQKRCIS
jgi:hypothetical protein